MRFSDNFPKCSHESSVMEFSRVVACRLYLCLMLKSDSEVMVFNFRKKDFLTGHALNWNLKNGVCLMSFTEGDLFFW